MDGHPRRLAYADPPYPGLSARYYSEHPDFAGEVDHAELVASLSAEFDAWALSTSAAALPAVLALCPPGVRVAAWFRGERPHKGAGAPLNAWEPVIYAGQIIRRTSTGDASSPGQLDASALQARPVALAGGHDARHAGATRRVGPSETRRRADRDDASSSAPRRVDALVHVARPRTTDPARVVGAKPAAFCRWVFELLGAQPGDELVDVFPGSGGVARAWEAFTTVHDDASLRA